MVLMGGASTVHWLVTGSVDIPLLDQFPALVAAKVEFFGRAEVGLRLCNADNFK
ncbi:MAG TPA: hypothetical protein V6D19_20405 [Stenomitos sp.]